MGAVNAALRHYDGGDVLFLNADTVLPEGAIERLRRAVYSSPEIGTATPFSNNGEFTSFPVPFRSNALPSLEDIEALDRAFAQSNASITIPMPNGIGFCLYVRRDCFQSVGALSHLYAPGYGEDIEFCLTAAERGFRNVCAADVFVGHAGSLSFRAAKRALVVRNLRVLHERFPEYRAECAAFLHADPLAKARARAERNLPPAGPTRWLVVGARDQDDAAEARRRSLGRLHPDLSVVVMRPGAKRGEFECRAAKPQAPQSLSLDFDDPEERSFFCAYLRESKPDRIEVFGVGNIARDVLETLAGTGATIDVLCADSWPLKFQPRETGGACSPRVRGGAMCGLCGRSRTFRCGKSRRA